jgi:TolB-like protein
MTMTEFQLDVQDQRLLNGGQPVQLTSKAFQLLRLFVENPNRLLTKDDILDSVWRDVFVSEGLVKEYVHDLRLALGDDARQPKFIETVHGRGYRFLGGVKASSSADSIVTSTNLRSQPPTLAVLPFTNLTGETRWDRFCHGLSDDLIIDMSRYPDLVVTASMDPANGLDARELTTDYALNGSVQLSGDQVRINVKLVETGGGAHLWTEQYERELGEFFAIQGDIVGHVVSAVGGFGGQIPHAERLRLGRVAPEDLQAYELYLQGHELEARFEKESTLRAFELMQRAVTLEPDYARAWFVRGWTCWQIILEDWANDAKNYHELWRESFLKAAALDPLDPIAMMELAAVRAADQDITGARDALERALDLGRYQADLLISSANPIALILDDPQRAKETLNRGLELIAVVGDWHRLSMSRVAYFTGDFEQALEDARRGPDNLLTQLMEILSLAQLGDAEHLKGLLRAFRARHSSFDPQEFVKRYPITANGARELFFDGIGKAGLN